MSEWQSTYVYSCLFQTTVHWRKSYVRNESQDVPVVTGSGDRRAAGTFDFVAIDCGLAANAAIDFDDSTDFDD